MLDNRYALLFIRGERPVMDLKYDIMKHPDIDMTADGKTDIYCHGNVNQSIADISLGDSFDGEINEQPQTDLFEILSDEDLEALLDE